MKDQGNKKEKSFEAALKGLEKIVSEMEQGDLSLDTMLKKFDEGMRLARFCSGKLEEAEKKIEFLVRKEDGSIEAREFSPSAEAALDHESSNEGGSQDEEPLEEDNDDEAPLF